MSVRPSITQTLVAIMALSVVTATCGGDQAKSRRSTTTSIIEPDESADAFPQPFETPRDDSVPEDRDEGSGKPIVVVPPPPAPSPLDGKQIYTESCSGCHLPLEQSEKLGRTEFQITGALANIPDMQGLRISAEKIAAIAAALAEVELACDIEIGHSAPRRLNNLEYHASIRDLFELGGNLPDLMLPKQVRGSFANNANALRSDLAYVEALATATKRAVDEAFSSKRTTIVTCDSATIGAVPCATQIIDRLGPLAFRHPLTSSQRQTMLTLFNDTLPLVTNFDDAMKAVLRGMLMSAHFAFRMVQGDGVAEKDLDGFELASNLSYFLWSSAPDAELLRAASDQSLLSDQTLTTQVARMLKDPRAQTLASQFFATWFDLERIDGAEISDTAFPIFTDALRLAMRRESELLFANLVADETSIYGLLEADYSFLDQNLAQLYAIPGNFSAAHVRTPLLGSNRVGILGHASFLTMTSDPEDSSVIRRGQWIMTNLLCDPPPAPPGNINGIDPNAVGATKREIFLSHRRSPACYGCHTSLEPVGFGLEGFDAIGGLRSTLTGPIDNNGQMPDGRTYSGALELAAVVKADRRYTTCFTRKMLTFALGRELSRGETCAAQKISDGMANKDMTFGQLVTAIVKSPNFRQQK